MSLSYIFFKKAGLKSVIGSKLKASLTVRSNFRRVFQDAGAGGSGGFGVQKRVNLRGGSVCRSETVHICNLD